MTDSLRERLEINGWTLHEGPNRVSISIPDIGQASIVWAEGATKGRLYLPDSLAGKFQNQFSVLNNMWAWENFGTVVEWLLNVVLTPIQKQSESEIREIAEELGREPITEQMSVGKRRKFQEKLRDVLLRQRKCCEVSGVADAHLLIASHILPWSKCVEGGRQKLDLQNVLLLACNWDALFDKFYISFGPETGMMLKARRINADVLKKFGVPDDWEATIKIDVSGARRKGYLTWHMEEMNKRDVEAGF